MAKSEADETKKTEATNHLALFQRMKTELEKVYTNTEFCVVVEYSIFDIDPTKK